MPINTVPNGIGLTDDPETQILKQLFTLLQASNNFQATNCKIENVAAQDWQQFKQILQPGDLPEVVIIPSTAGIHMGPTSLAMQFDQVFRLVIVSDTERMLPYSQLKHIVLAIMYKAAGQYLGLTGLVKSVKIVNCKDDLFGNREWTRGTHRFMGICDLEVQYYLSTDALNQLAE